MEKSSDVNSLNIESIANTSQCTNWYLRTTYYLSDGSTYHTDEFLGTTCDGDNCGFTAPGGEFTACDHLANDDLGGLACCIDPNMQLTSNSVSQTISDNCGLEGVDPTSGNPTKTCSHSWDFNTNTLAFYTWKYISIEEADQEKVGNEWTFKTLRHTGIGSSGTIPPCVNFSCSINSATPSISSNRKQARMDIIYTTDFNVSCCPWCSPRHDFLTGYSNWIPQ